MRTKHYKVYSFDELSNEAREKAIAGQIDFEIETMNEDSPYWQHALKMEKMQTPWFLGETLYHKERASLIETIKINEYEFTRDGKID